MLDLPHIVPEYENSNCSACRLNCGSRLQLAGHGYKKILIVFDAQDAIQQTTKTYFCGSRYTYVRDLLYKYGITTDDIWMTSTIQCYSEYKEEKHAIHCKPNLIKTIKRLKPVLVIGFGEFTAKMLLSYIIEDGIFLDRVHGWVHPNRELGCNMMFTYTPHPGSAKYKTIEEFIIERDVHMAIKSLAKPPDTYTLENKCVRLLEPKEAAMWLRDRINDKTERFSALDYETNCLKPYNPAAKLYSCAVCEDFDNSYAFKMDDTTYPLMREYWATKHIRKIAHNSAFERMWTMVKLKVMPRRLIADTMLLAHVLDNRDVKWLSIKFIGPMLTGCSVWNGHIESYLEPSKQDKKLYGEYALNRVASIPIRQLLTYNAIDSLVEFRTFFKLYEMLKNFYGTFPIESENE